MNLDKNGKWDGQSLVLSDFGVSIDTAKSQTIVPAGTMGYASYEQLYGNADCRSDLCSLAVVLLTLVTNDLVAVFKRNQTSVQNFTHYMIFLDGDLHITRKPRNVKISKRSIFFSIIEHKYV